MRTGAQKYLLTGYMEEMLLRLERKLETSFEENVRTFPEGRRRES